MRLLLLPLLAALLLPGPAAAREKLFKKKDGSRVRVRQDADRSVTRKEATAQGEQITISGRRTTPIVLSGRRGLVIDGKGGTLQCGGRDGIDLQRCEDLTIRDLTITGCVRGLRLRFCKRVLITNVICRLNSQQGFLISDSSDVTLRHCEGSKTRVEHGAYFAQGLSRITVEDSSFFETGRSAFQVNAESGPAPATGVRLKNVRVNNGFACNFLGAEFLWEGGSITGQKALVLDVTPTGRRFRSKGELRSVQVRGKGWNHGKAFTVPASGSGKWQ